MTCRCVDFMDIARCPVHGRRPSEGPATREKFRRCEELDALPNHAVVIGNDQQVWQQLTERDQGFAEVGYGYVWFTPGDLDGCQSGAIELPAWLLDDGR